MLEELKQKIERRFRRSAETGPEFLLEEDRIIADIVKADLYYRDKIKLYYRLADYSPVKGVELANKLGLSGQDKFFIFESKPFWLKHRKLMTDLTAEVVQNSDLIEPDVVQRFREIKADRSVIAGDHISVSYFTLENNSYDLDEPAKQLAQRMDEYYAQFLKVKSVAAPEQGGSSPYAVVDSQVREIKNIFTESYYFGPAMDMLWDMAPKEGELSLKAYARRMYRNPNNRDVREKYPDAEGYWNALLNGQENRRQFLVDYVRNKANVAITDHTLIRKEELQTILKNLGSDFDLRTENRLKKDRYKADPITFSLRGEMAREIMLDDVQNSVPFNQELFYDDEKGIFDLRAIEGEEKPVIKEHKNYGELGTQAVIINGEPLFRLTRADNRTELIYRGRLQGPYNRVLNVREYDGQPFMVVQGFSKDDQNYYLVNQYGETIATGPRIEFIESAENGSLYYQVLHYDHSEIYSVSSKEPELINFDTMDTPYKGKSGWSWVSTRADGRKIFNYPKGAYSKPYDAIINVVEVGDQFIFQVASEDGRSFFVFQDGTESLPGSQSTDYAVAGDAIYYVLSNGNTRYIMKNKQMIHLIKNEEGDIKNIRPYASGNHVFYKVSYDGGEEITLHHDSMQTSRLFEEIEGFDGDINGEPVYTIIENGREKVYSGATQFANFKSIRDVIVKGDKVFVLGSPEEDSMPVLLFPNGVEVDATPNDVRVLGGKESVYAIVKNLVSGVRVYNKDGNLIFENLGRYVATGMFGEDLVLILYNSDNHSTEKFVISADGTPLAGGQDSQGEPSAEELTIKEKLQILNLLTNPTAERVDEFRNFWGSDPVEWGQEDKTGALSRRAVHYINRIFKDAPLTFANTVAAVRDKSSDAHAIFNMLFPEVAVKKAKRKNLVHRYFRDKGKNVRALFDIPQKAAGIFRSFSEINIEGGDPTKKGETALELRERVNEFIITSLYGKYDRKERIWGAVDFPIEPELDEPVKEYTWTLPNIDSNGEVVLPMLPGSKIIPERIRGIEPGGKEVVLDYRRNESGQAIVQPTAQSQKIVYSFSRSENPSVPTEIAERTYEIFRKSWIRERGADLTDDIAVLTPEMLVFLESIKNNTPREKIAKIEKFIRDMGYYDMANGEAKDAKAGMSMEQRFEFMETRLAELRKDPRLGPALVNKRYAGVCADFNFAVAAMLRKAGFVAGTAGGFMPSSTKLDSGEYHLTAFVVWPSSKGQGYKVITVDGTPGAVTPEQKDVIEKLQQPSLEQKQEIVREQKEQQAKEIEKEFEQIEKTLANYDDRRIQEISNGELERVLNSVLRHKVRHSHYEVMKRVFDAARYSEFNNRDLGDIDTRVQFAKFLDQEIASQRAGLSPADDALPAGEKFMELIQEAADFYIKTGKAKTKADAYKAVRQVVDLCQSRLDDTENRALMVVLNYLQAKKVS